MKYILYLISLFAFVTTSSCSKNSGELTENSAVPPTVSEIVTMSFNIRNSGGDTDQHKWDNRKTSCLAMINSIKPALIGMQEVRPNQKTYFEENLKDYTMLGIARDGSGSSTEHSSVCFRSDLFTLINSGTFWLSATPDLMSKGWDGDCYRICTWVKLKVKGSTKELFFFNTHLDHKGVEARAQGLLLIKDRIKKIAGTDALVILTGDFNMTPDNANILSFASFMKSVREQFEGGKNYNEKTFNGWGTSSSIIDYILYQNTNPTSYKVVNGMYSGVTYISDHYPIISVFSL